MRDGHVKLYYSPTSAFARKARICVIEYGLADRTELRLWVADTEGKNRVHHDTVFNGKGQ